MTYVLYFLAGIFGANGVPHFVKGITGERHMTPFGKPSSAIVNVIWGAANLYFTAWLAYWAYGRGPISGWHGFLFAGLAVLAGVILMGILLAANWQNDEKAKGK